MPLNETARRNHIKALQSLMINNIFVQQAVTTRSVAPYLGLRVTRIKNPSSLLCGLRKKMFGMPDKQ